MHSLTIQLAEPTYTAIAQAAADHGLSVEAMVAGQLEADFSGGDVGDSFFTPAILAEIDAAVIEADQFGGFTPDEVRQEIAAKSRAWRASHPA